MITIVSTGRDDNYGEKFIERYFTSVSENCKILESFEIDYEYIMVEWNPINGNYLHMNEMLKKLFENPRIKNIIVDPKVSIKENLRTDIFYEYFAKNVGVRNANKDNILIINSDIILSEEIVFRIKNLISNELTSDRFFRARTRNEINYDLSLICSKDIYHESDGKILGNFSGDFLLVTKKNFIEVGRGYDETNPRHRNNNQTHMDSEILWNFYNGGMKLEMLSESYSHINHGKPHQYEIEYNNRGYKNKDDWGFIKYEKIKLTNNVFLIQ